MLTPPFPTPADTTAALNGAPVTRRQLREAERLAARRGSRRTPTRPGGAVRAPAGAPIIGMPPAAAAPDAASVAVDAVPAVSPFRTSRTSRTSRRRGYASQGLSVVAMAFVATVTIATSLPANALLDSADISSAPLRAAAPLPAEPAQTVTVANGAVDPVNRGTYTVEPYREIVVAQTDGTAASFANSPSSAIQWPFVDAVPISGTFGHRVAPCSNGCSSDHKGVDFAPGAGTPIRSIADGVVRYVESSDYGLGVHVIVDHMIDGNLVTSVYAHMQFGSLGVAQGQVVTVGQQIGAVGNTGASTGAHLHLEIRMADGTPVDPYAWLKAHAG
ncbi:M23 family metallopeptidase [Planctomonas psychrotolerans]|uniref:M23 family metallopeptidase n=1 Tax=Planctomonas psychrotolerans TaxID=2528712 RepID=UPI00123A7A5C|nr:M23 family metallopeptidase [Planctomonas psychrotolerans]